MGMLQSKRLMRTETFLIVALVLLAVLIEWRSGGQFFTSNNMIRLSRALIIPAMFCIGQMMVIISGGVDVSFPAIASLSGFIVVTGMSGFEGSVYIMLMAGAILGLVMGALNGVIIGKFNFPALIVTLGTMSLFLGIKYGPLAAQAFPVPDQMNELGLAYLFYTINERDLRASMPVAILFLIALLVVAWFVMRRTMLGRGIYAVGGERVSAERAGFSVFKIQMFIYCFTGFMAGFIGVTHASLTRTYNPTSLDGMELTVIAACVLGGVSITGGKGSILGTMLGVILLTTVNTSLILLRIPLYWQRVFTGAVILIGTGISAYHYMKRRRQLSVDVAEEVA